MSPLNTFNPTKTRTSRIAEDAAAPPPPVPAASSDRVAECALRCLLAVLHETFAARPWDEPLDAEAAGGEGPGDGGSRRAMSPLAAAAKPAGAEPRAGAAEQGLNKGLRLGQGDRVTVSLEHQDKAKDLEAAGCNPNPSPAPMPGVLVDLLQRVAALADLGREHAAEEVLSSRKGSSWFYHQQYQPVNRRCVVRC